MGAGGRDFHTFNVAFRDNPAYRVVAFTAAQIPGIAGRTYPPALSGQRYPRGIPIVDEAGLAALVRRRKIDLVVLAYSDLSHADTMHRASTALAAGASFAMLGPDHTMLRTAKPVIAVCAVRTGAGKSPASRRIVRWALERGLRPGIVRHPMPYGDLERQAVQRFVTPADLDAANCTIEEREEYEPYLRMGVPVHAGVDYARVLELAQLDVDLLIWDGGNNDLPFVRPDLHIVLADALRPGHESAYHPGEANARMADLFVITKAGSASKPDVRTVRENLRQLKPRTPIILADLEVSTDRPELVAGRRVAVVEDGPTLTHGGVPSGAGVVLARRLGAEIVDPRPHAQGSLRETLAAYPHITQALPAMGYSAQQIRDLEASLRDTPADVVLDATPVDLTHLLSVDVPVVQVSYELRERGQGLVRALNRFATRHLLA